MSYHPSQVNRSAGAEIPSGIVYFGHSPTGQVYEADANFTIDGTYLNAAKIKLPNNGTIGVPSLPGAITIGSDGTVSVLGDLTVNGTTTTVNSTTVTVQDPIIRLGASGTGSPTIDDNKDRGVSFAYYDGVAKTGFFGFDDSSAKFTFVPDATITNEVVSGVVGIIVADLEGNAHTASGLLNARDFSVTGQVIANAVSFNGTNNVALTASLDASAITSQSELLSVNSTGDYLLIYDSNASSLKKINRNSFVSGLGAMSSFDVTDGTTTITVNDGETITFASGVGAEMVLTDAGGGVPTFTINTVDSEIVHDNLSGFDSNEHVNHTGVTIVAGSGLVGGGDITSSRTLDIVGSDGITVSSGDIKVTIDDSTINFTVTNGNGAIQVKDAGITEAKRNRTIETITSSKLLDKDVTLINATTSSVTGYLPENATAGRIMVVKRIDGNAESGPYDVIISASGSDTIDGSNLFQLYYKYETLTFISNGADWFII